MNTNNIFFQHSKLFFICFVLLFSITLRSFSGSLPENGDQKNVIAIGKKLATLDDIRLGDYSIKANDPILSTAHKELRTLLGLLLQLKQQPYEQNIALDKLIEKSKTSLPVLHKHNATPEILWNADNQCLLDEEIEANYETLKEKTQSKETQALLTYIHAQYLFTKKHTREGMDVLRSIVKDFTGTPYEPRAQGEMTFRLFLDKKYMESLQQAKMTIELYPNTKESHDARYFKGRSHYQLQQYKESLTDVDTFIEKNPTSKWNESAKYFRAKTNSILKNNEIALKQFADFIKEYPHSTYRDDAREMMARVCANEKDYQKAIALFDLYKQENPDIFEQMAADKKIKFYSYQLRFTPEIQKNKIKFAYYDSIYTSFPKTMEKYIAQSQENAVKAQGYFAIADHYLQFDPAKALQYVILLDSPLFTTTKTGSAPKSKGCNDCDYGLIYKPMLEYLKAKIYIKLDNDIKLSEIKLALQQTSPQLYNKILIQEIEHLGTKKQYAQAETRALNLYNNKSLPSHIRSQALYSVGGNAYEQGDIIKAKKFLQQLVLEFPYEGPANPAQWMLEQINNDK